MMLPIPKRHGTIAADQIIQFIRSDADATPRANPHVATVSMARAHGISLTRTIRDGRNSTTPERGPGFKRQFFRNRS
jgi:hypothetical protein